MIAEIIKVAEKVRLRDYKPGYVGKPYAEDSVWYLSCPQCGYRYRLSLHVVLEDGDDLSIMPSLQCTNEKCGAHFYVTKNSIHYV